MSGRASKNKGKAGEREICGILSEKLGGSFARVPYSGAFIGKSNVFRKEFLSENQIKGFKGDVIPPDNLKKMVIEVKNYADFPFHALLREDDIPILDGKDGWIQQTKDVLDVGDVWFLMFKINNKGWFIVFEQKYIESYKLCVKLNRKDYTITDLKTFLDNNSTKIIEICS